jgi:hypothetical protein
MSCFPQPGLQGTELQPEHGSCAFAGDAFEVAKNQRIAEGFWKRCEQSLASGENLRALEIHQRIAESWELEYAPAFFAHGAPSGCIEQLASAMQRRTAGVSVQIIGPQFRDPIGAQQQIHRDVLSDVLGVRLTNAAPPEKAEQAAP